ncbi:MAG TPA: hypothetical protein VFA77_07255 [Candidatus Eisenbacteria bacterium]|jgi:hypothetical protein|nr:hypothetical protein [Candidatus Eisenbacteria bacterium]
MRSIKNGVQVEDHEVDEDFFLAADFALACVGSFIQHPFQFRASRKFRPDLAVALGYGEQVSHAPCFGF